MKNLSNINLGKAVRRMVTSATLLFILLSTATAVHATDKVKNPPADIKYIGSVDSKPIFQIDFANQDAEEVSLTLKDQYGTVIYTDLVKDKNYTRKLQLDNVDSNIKLVLSLRSKKGVQTQQFQINKNVRVVEDVVIAKL
jgi:hypothetical protein